MEQSSAPCLLQPKKVVKATNCQSGQLRSRMDGPDGGWAWCVALSACLINFIMAGLGRMSGILYVAFIELFHVDRKGAAAPFSVRSSVRNLLGPIVGILGQKYGVRTVTIVGGVIGSLSSALCFYTDDITWITVVWGGINGLGTALTTTLPQVVIGQYFHKHRTTASGMAFSGGCVGAFMFPALIELLLHKYGLPGTFLIMGGIIMHVIPAAMILRKPSWVKAEAKAAALAAADQDARKSIGDAEHVENGKADEDDVFEPPKRTQRSTHRSVVFSEIDETYYSPMENNSTTRKSIRSIRNVDNEVPKTTVDVQFLRNNMELVWKVILTVVKNRNGDDKEAAVEGVRTDEEFCQGKGMIANELEDMYQKLEKPVKYEEAVLANALRHSVSHLKSVDDVFVRNTKSQSYFYEACPNEGWNNRIKSTGELDRTHEVGMFFILTLLRELCNKEHFILNDGQTADQKVVDELCKAYKELNHKAFKEVNLSESSDVFESKSPLLDKSPCSISEAETESLKSGNSQLGKAPAKNGFLDLLKTAVMLYRKPLFVLICVCRSVHFITFIPVVTVVVDFGMDKGLLAEDGKYIIAALSVGDLVGRLGLGWVTDRGFLGLPKYMLLAMILQGASTASLPFMQSKALLLPAIALFGLLQGSVFVRHPVLVSNYMPAGEQSIAHGCINFLSGFIGFGLPHYIGYFRDTLGSYDNMFYITGAVGTTIGLLWLLEPYLIQCTDTESTDAEIQPPSEDV